MFSNKGERKGKLKYKFPNVNFKWFRFQILADIIYLNQLLGSSAYKIKLFENKVHRVNEKKN